MARRSKRQLFFSSPLFFRRSVLGFAFYQYSRSCFARNTAVSSYKFSKGNQSNTTKENARSVDVARLGYYLRLSISVYQRLEAVHLLLNPLGNSPRFRRPIETRILLHRPNLLLASPKMSRLSKSRRVASVVRLK